MSLVRTLNFIMYTSSYVSRLLKAMLKCCCRILYLLQNIFRRAQSDLVNTAQEKPVEPGPTSGWFLSTNRLFGFGLNTTDATAPIGSVNYDYAMVNVTLTLDNRYAKIVWRLLYSFVSYREPFRQKQVR